MLPSRHLLIRRDKVCVFSVFRVRVRVRVRVRGGVIKLQITKRFVCGTLPLCAAVVTSMSLLPQNVGYYVGYFPVPILRG